MLPLWAPLISITQHRIGAETLYLTEWRARWPMRLEESLRGKCLLLRSRAE